MCFKILLVSSTLFLIACGDKVPEVVARGGPTTWVSCDTPRAKGPALFVKNAYWQVYETKNKRIKGDTPTGSERYSLQRSLALWAPGKDTIRINDGECKFVTMTTYFVHSYLILGDVENSVSHEGRFSTYFRCDSSQLGGAASCKEKRISPDYELK